MILKRVTIVVLLFVLFFMLLIINLPKKSLWYETEAFLSSKQLIFDDEKVDDLWFSLKVSDAMLYAGSLNVARIEAINITLLGFYNTVCISNLLVGSDLRILHGLQVKEARVSHIPFMDVSISAQGNFGSLKGSIDFDTRTYVLDIKGSSWLKKQYILMKKLKKTKQGYRFAGKF